MVSPSKIQHQEHKQPPREYKFTKQSHVRVRKDNKPLEGKTFYLDIKNHATTAKIEAKIKDLGGVIELFLVQNVTLVVSDRVNKSGDINFEKYKWGCASGGSGGPPSLRSLETPTPVATPQTPYFSPDCALSNSTSLRGPTTQRSKSRVDAMLERALIQPQQCSVDPLYNAQNWGIRIWSIDKLQTWLDRIYSSVKDTDPLKRSKQSCQQSSSKDLKVRHLKGPYIKFEAFRRNTRPVFVELPVWPTLNFSGPLGSCPFNAKRREKPEKLRADVKENRERIQPVKEEEDKEMTRRPRTTGTRARRTEQLASGYCEICRISYRDLSKHVQSDQHLNFVRNNDNFLSLDNLINAGANVEAFLKLNRTKDIEKDCNLFSNGDRNLHDIVLPEGKVSRNSKSLGDFEVDDIKMVQCNGARRNLNLRLSSPHNLRTRAKHESGHLLRSKGSPWHEVDKTEKIYDKFEGYTIKKRAKGTIWIEEDDPEDELMREQVLNQSKQNEFKIDTFTAAQRLQLKEKRDNERDCGAACNKQIDVDNQDLQRTIPCNNEQNNSVSAEYVKQDRDSVQYRNHDQTNGSVQLNYNENTLSVIENGCNNSCRTSRSEIVKGLNGKLPVENVKKVSEVCGSVDADADVVCNGHVIKDDAKVETLKPRYFKSSRRGGRGFRGRHRLSVEERLIEDNRAYYKVEVLGSKLRSSVVSNNNSQCTVQKDVDDEEKKEVPSSEKPVVVRFKRVRKSELSLLSDEAESFMFGEPRRDDSSEASDDEQSSVLPRETESDYNDTVSSACPSSSIDCSTPIKTEPIEEDSQDSLSLGRARKRRRTQAEALIKDNENYYKFETPGSRLRYQAPLTGIREPLAAEETTRPPIQDREEVVEKVEADEQERVYPSKPSPEVEKMQFSFEAVPKSEPWYQTYQRQDEGAEFWHYFSEGDSQKPFLLPYEIDNFHEVLTKNLNRSDSRRKGRGRISGCAGRSPRKSPRCHASTLAIMSTIIRKREQQQQQQQPSNLYTIEECRYVGSQTSSTPGPDQKVEVKSDVDEDLKEMVKTIDEMLNANDAIELEDSFEPGVAQIEQNPLYEPSIPKGPPSNLLELLENCHELANCLENSSCASSECGEVSVESPSKRRKKRKNRTGWPGIKLKKKLQAKHTVDTDCDRGNLSRKNVEQNETSCNAQDMNTLDRLAEEATSVRISSTVAGISRDTEQSIGLDRQHREEDDECLCKTYTENTSCRDALRDEEEKSDASIEIIDNSTVLRTNTSTETTCTELLTPAGAGGVCTESERNFLINKDFAFKKEHLLEIEEISENDPGNDENHVFGKDVNLLAERRVLVSKTSMKKRQRDNTSTETCESRAELENHENLCRKETESGIVARNHHNANGLPRKRSPQKLHPEDPDPEMEHRNNVYRGGKVGRRPGRRRIHSRKRAKRNNMSSDTAYEEDENCKEEAYLNITCKKQQSLRGVKRRAEHAVSSETTQNSEIECALSGRVSPALMATSELEQRRSSIEFQPVVRMMKIDEQVDMDHSILSVTIASNRRLRSSSSPRSNVQPPKKRLKTGRGQFGRWLKSS